MAKPTGDPTFATDATYDPGSNPWDGDPTRVALATGLREQGFKPTQRPGAQEFNEIIGVHGDYLEWLDAVTTTAIGGASAVDWTYETPPTRTVVINAFHAIDLSATVATGPGWGGVLISGNSYARQAKKDSAVLGVPLNQHVPHGAEITLIEAMVTLGATRTGADRVQLSWQQPVLNWSTPSATYGALEDTADDGGAAGGSTVVITCTPTPAIALESLDNAWPVAIVIKAGNNASTNPDNLHGLRVTYIDPGPRNF